jgi:hypothetical protein
LAPFDLGSRTSRTPKRRAHNHRRAPAFVARRLRDLDVSRDDVVSDFRSLYGERWDEKAMELALIGGLVQLGVPLHPADRAGRRGRGAGRGAWELAWWTPKVTAALERWSPV